MGDLREAVSDLMHTAWAHWTRYMLDTIHAHFVAFGHDAVVTVAPKVMKDLGLGKSNDPTAVPVELLFEALSVVKRWRRQIDTPYEKLSEKEKDSDREWADKVGALVARAKPSPNLPDQWVERAQALLSEIGIKMPTWMGAPRAGVPKCAPPSSIFVGSTGTSSGPVTIQATGTSSNIQWLDGESDPKEGTEP